jgi:hypothetical protein
MEKPILKEESDNEINSCCQTLCISSVVKEYIEQLEQEIKILKERLGDD